MSKSMTEAQAQAFLDALDEELDALDVDEEALTVDEIRDVLRAEGYDPDKMVAELRAMVQELLTNFRMSHPGGESEVGA